MGGEIHVESAHGKGSTFSFTTLHKAPTKEELAEFLRRSSSSEDRPLVALLPGDAALSTDPNSLDSSPPKFRMIGVAEDNPINLQHLARHLKMLGYQYTLCTNGQEILDKVCKSNSSIDCCILDMSMPVMGTFIIWNAHIATDFVVDGMESARHIRQFESSGTEHGARPRMPIIAL